jgi:hypothetical protein
VAAHRKAGRTDQLLKTVEWLPQSEKEKQLREEKKLLMEKEKQLREEKSKLVERRQPGPAGALT